VSEFCRNHDLKPSVLQRHMKRQRLGKVESKEVKRLVPVALVGTKRHADTPRECALEVVLSRGRRIDWTANGMCRIRSCNLPNEQKIVQHPPRSEF
jgi:hypothetical protein